MADQVTKINPRELPQIDAVYVMVGTNNIKDRCSCDSVFNFYTRDHCPTIYSTIIL